MRAASDRKMSSRPHTDHLLGMNQSWWRCLTPASPLKRSVWEGKLAPMTFRPFARADIEPCLELYELNEPGRFPPGGLPEYLSHLAQRRAYTICLDGPDGLVACGGLAYHEGRRHSGLLCYGLVHPAHHGTGIGTALLLARLALLDPNRHWYSICIAALEKSFGFYRRFGFSSAGSWCDKSGARHTFGALFIFGYQIRRIRKLLAAHKVEYPAGDGNLIPCVPALESRVRPATQV